MNELQPGARLRDFRYEERSLAGAGLQGIHLHGGSLARSDISGADLERAVLRDCVLDGVRAAGCRLVQARIEDSSAVGIDLSGANLAGAILHQTDFSRGCFDRAGLRGALADGASFRGASLRDADLREVRMHDADFRGADLRGSAFDGADLAGADFRGALVEGLSLEGAALRGCRFDSPDRTATVETEVSMADLLQALRQGLPAPQGPEIVQRLQPALAGFDGDAEAALRQLASSLAGSGLVPAAASLSALTGLLDSLDRAPEDGELAHWQPVLEQLFPELADGSLSYDELADRLAGRTTTRAKPSA